MKYICPGNFEDSGSDRLLLLNLMLGSHSSDKLFRLFSAWVPLVQLLGIGLGGP